ncbi:C1 family peptidase [Clostridium sp. C8-1-8]|uniref:C1 family peptidase n=1 Tax=Clostridium sp. C8-1-8 TaxID=2698831 RepID=UPI001FAB8C88|nr:C1 family peptidase [Clostridium sp. C8-1-8]
MDIKSRFKNYGLWVSVLALIPIILKVFGLDIMPNNYNELVTAVLGIIVLFGIISNPATEEHGYKDDKRSSNNDNKINRKYVLKEDKFDGRDYYYKDHPSVKLLELPKSVDLREKMPPIYEQGQLGSCTANAGCANEEYFINNRAELSRLFLYYKERLIQGTVDEDSGASIRDICVALKNSGICEESFYPYDISKFTAEPSAAADQNALQYTINSYHRITSLEEVKQALASALPVLLGITVYESFENVGKDGFVPMPSFFETMLGGHAVLLVGYVDNNWKKQGDFSICGMIRKRRNNNGYFILRNSWGTDFGDKGYMYLPYEVFEKIKNDIWVIIQ